MAREKGKHKLHKVKEKEKKETKNSINATGENTKRKRGRKPSKPSTNAARERSRVQNLKQAFLELQKALPNVPQGTKLSKLDILLLATNYISHLMSRLSNGHLEEHLNRLKDKGALHPIKKWPMRSRLYVSDPVWLYRSQGLANQRGRSCLEDITLKTEENEGPTNPLSPSSSSLYGSSDIEASPSYSRQDQSIHQGHFSYEACCNQSTGNSANTGYPKSATASDICHLTSEASCKYQDICMD